MYFCPMLHGFSLFILATDPFASVFGSESFEDGFADFSTLSKVTCSDQWEDEIFYVSTSGATLPPNYITLSQTSQLDVIVDFRQK